MAKAFSVASWNVEHFKSQDPGAADPPRRPDADHCVVHAEDGVVARDHIPFKKFGGSEVSVCGWPKIAEPDEQLRWVREISDHGLLFFEVQRPPQ
jgi:hypothetical protein